LLELIRSSSYYYSRLVFISFLFLIPKEIQDAFGVELYVEKLRSANHFHFKQRRKAANKEYHGRTRKLLSLLIPALRGLSQNTTKNSEPITSPVTNTPEDLKMMMTTWLRLTMT